MPDKNDDQKKLLPDQRLFNLVVDYLSGVGLYFPRGEVHRPNGAGYCFVLERSRLFSHLDGHYDKLTAASSSMPVSLLFNVKVHKVGSGTTHSLP